MKYLFLLLLLSSCASLNKEECKTMNWFQKGKDDALAGKTSPLIKKYQKQCADHGLEVNDSRYKEGFDAGLKKYCGFASGFDLGAKGNPPHKHCERISEDFKRGYKKGSEDFAMAKLKMDQTEKLKKKIIEENGGFTCQSSFDCTRDGDCYFGKCRGSDVQCTFNSDCKYEGKCIKIEGWTEYNESVTANVCKFKE